MKTLELFPDACSFITAIVTNYPGQGTLPAGGLRSVGQSRRFQQSGIEVISFALIMKIAHVPSECPVRTPEADSLP